MDIRLVSVVSLILFGSQFSMAQRFCNHMRMQQQTAINNTLDPRADTFDVISYEINASFLAYESQKGIDATTTLKIALLKSAKTVT